MTRAERRRAARQQEAAEVRYQLTAMEIREIEKRAVESKKEQIRDKIMQEVKDKIMQEVKEEWKRREEMFSGEDDKVVLNVLSLLLAIPVKVLCEKFGWKPYPLNKEENKNSRILKFSREVIKETNDIFADENADIRNYVEEVYQKYGVKYHMEDA